MGRESQIAILLRIELLLKDLFEVLDGAPRVTSKRSPSGKKSLEDFYKVGAYKWKGTTPNGAVKCGLCERVFKGKHSMLGPQGHLWLQHRKEMVKNDIRY